MIHLKKYIAAQDVSESEFVICDRETGDTVCSVPVGKSQEDAHLRANRIVHGMNAIEGIDTAELAEIAATGGMLGPREDVARIAKERDELLASEHKLSDAYIRLRTKLAAFDTPEAPTPEQVYTNTEAKLDALIKQRDELLAALEQFVEEFEGCYADGDPAMIKARAAIASAKGGA